jgi:hypothetical protein
MLHKPEGGQPSGWPPFSLEDCFEIGKRIGAPVFCERIGTCSLPNPHHSVCGCVGSQDRSSSGVNAFLSLGFYAGVNDTLHR